MGDSGAPLGSILIPAYREEAGIRSSLARVAAALDQIDRYQWEIVVVDDGSPDGTSAEIEAAQSEIDIPIKRVRHTTNQGLGGALRTGFGHTEGVVVIVMDSDLSYHEDHIAALLEKWESSRAHIVIASPYAEGGESTGVPSLLDRRSRIANRVLSTTAQESIKTLTGMVRAYDGPFIRSLSLKAVDVDINVEIIYKTQLLRGTIVEIPGHLNWSGMEQRAARSSVLGPRSRLNTAKSLVLAFLFRPFLFPLVPGLVLGVIGIVLAAMGKIGWGGVGVVSLILGTLLTISSLSMLQAKRYFEELYFQASRSESRYSEAPFAHPQLESRFTPLRSTENGKRSATFDFATIERRRA